MGGDSQSGWAVVEARVRLIALQRATGGEGSGAYGGVLIVVLILPDVVAGDVEAGRVGKIEDIEGVLEVEALGELRGLNERSVRPPLIGLAEDVALPGGEVGFIGVSLAVVRAIRNGTPKIAGIQQWNRKAIGLEEGVVLVDLGERAGVAGCGGSCVATIGKRHNRIRDAVIHAVIDAGDGTRVIDDAERLPALNNGDSFQRPTIG